MNPVTVRPMEAADAREVLAIYQTGLDSGDASFRHRLGRQVGRGHRWRDVVLVERRSPHVA